MTIKQIQHLLAYLGYYTGAVDGIWGTQSASATSRFQ
jgi:peptidoglycan hydrolase-like protein with peptidoglycan-binding domain